MNLRSTLLFLGCFFFLSVTVAAAPYGPEIRELTELAVIQYEYLPVGEGLRQEFLRSTMAGLELKGDTPAPPTARRVPEPAALGFMGTVLLVVANRLRHGQHYGEK